MISFRVDDFPHTKSEETWRHNLHTFAEFDKVMQKYGHRYTLGVIPAKLTLQEIEFLKTLAHVDLALHGINHDERFPNEFREWQTDQEVYDSLRSGKALLDTIGGPVDTYIPPHNVIDRKTIDALKKAGFSTLYCGPGSESAAMKYALQVGLNVFEHMPPFYGRSDEMMERGVVEAIRNSLTKDEDGYVALHWTWEVNIGLENLDKFLEKIDATHG